MQGLLSIAGVGEPSALAALAIIYATAAVFSGLSGFGFSAIGCLSLIVLPPQVGIAMLMCLSLVTQASSLGSLWRELRQHAGSWKSGEGVLPYLAGGTIGMPVGLAILALADARELNVALGSLLVGYSIWSLTKPTDLRLRTGAPAVQRSFLVGMMGGIVGGFSAFPGSAIVVWNGLLGVGKEQGRALTQPFILWMQAVGLVLLLMTRPQVFSAAFMGLFAAVVPLVLIGTAVGVAIYRKTGDVGYRRVTFAALGVSGLGLIAKVLIA
jgi:uncharacterized protein